VGVEARQSGEGAERLTAKTCLMTGVGVCAQIIEQLAQAHERRWSGGRHGAFSAHRPKRLK
jgi:hypothetical protein